MSLRTMFRPERRYLIASVLASRFINLGKDPSQVRPKSILVIKLDEIGDMATATHVFSMLKRDHPDARLTVLCKPFVAPLIEADPNVDHIMTSADGWTERYDVVVDLRGSWQTLRITLRQRPILRLDRAGVRLANKLGGGQLHETATNAAIIAPILRDASLLAPRLYSTESARHRVDAFLTHHGCERYALVAPGARSVLRRWPADRFAEIVRDVSSRYGLRFIGVGGPEDRPAINEIVRLAEGSAVAAPDDFTLRELVALCEGALLFVGNESGPMHVAASFGIPVVGIFGPGVPRVFDPIGPRSTKVHHVLSCNPCDQVNCVRPHDPCILMATVDEVRTAATNVLGM